MSQAGNGCFVPDATLEGSCAHLPIPASAQAPRDPSAGVERGEENVKPVTKIECAGGCGGGAVGRDLEASLLAADWIVVGGRWLCWQCAADPSIVTEVSSAGDL